MPAPKLRTEAEELELIKNIQTLIDKGYKQHIVLSKFGINKVYFKNIKKRNHK